MRILGIESSADETSASVVEDGYKLLSLKVASSMDIHTAYGGIVPEISARSHIEAIIPVIDEALAQAKTDWNGIDSIAVTKGPGLGGSLLIGALTALAPLGNPQAIKLPKAKMQSAYDFSFSGPKTAVLRASQKIVGKDYTLPSTELAGLLNDSQKADIAASFQYSAIDTLLDALEQGVNEFNPKSVVIAGGVAASSALRATISKRISPDITYTDMKLCTDNGAMIASLGYFMAKYNQPVADPFTLDIVPNLAM
jgi:tRNA A37 threonylcarbamoyltransferase TsaD